MGYFLALIGSIFWGFSGTFSQFLFQERNVSPEWLISSRSVIAGILLVLFAYARRGTRVFDIFTNKKDTLQLLIFSTVGIIGVQITYFFAIKNSNAATATVLQFLGPVLLVFTTHLVIKNSLSLLKSFP